MHIMHDVGFYLNFITIMLNVLSHESRALFQLNALHLTLQVTGGNWLQQITAQ